MFTLSERELVFFVLTVTIGLFILINNRINSSRETREVRFFSWLRLIDLILPCIVILSFLLFGVQFSFVNTFLLPLSSLLIYIYLSRLIKRKKEKKLENDDSLKVDTHSNETIDISSIPDQDIQTIKSIFSIDTFFSTEAVLYEGGVIFKGNLRGDSDTTHKLLSNKLQTQFSGKYCLFLVEGTEEKPVVIVLPNINDSKSMTILQKNLAIVLFLATIVTSLERTSNLLGFDIFNNWDRYQEIIPITLALWMILVFHEVGHYLVANFYGIKLSWPFFLPIWEFSSFGAITRFESLIPNRKTLFDISLAGPVLGGILSILFLISGLILSHSGSLLQITTQSFQKSILIGILAKVILGEQLQNSIISINPLVIVGWLGLVITALNLMPAGQLDGGRIIQAIYGRDTAKKSTVITLVILGIITIFNPNNLIPLYWIMVILFLQRDIGKPSLNELTEPNDIRAICALASMLIVLLVLIPLNPLLAVKIGIGG